MIYERRIMEVIRRQMAASPVVILEGPRTVGKSTLLGEIAKETQAGVIDLDEVDIRREVEADPAAYVTRPRPVLVDEHLRFRPLLEYIKAQLNKDGSPGQFVLTGSASADANRPGLNALLGRFVTVPVLPLAQTEIEEREGNFVEDVFGDVESLCLSGPSATSRDSYIERVLTGGFPLMVRSLDATDRYQRLTHYVDQSINYGMANLTEVRERHDLERLLYRYAAQTGQLLNIQKAAGDVGLKRGTAENYTSQLELLFLIHRLPAWKTTRRGPVSRPKLYVVDSGVAGRLLRLNVERVRGGEPLFRQQFGHLLETFVVGEVRKLLSWIRGPADVGYWRDRSGHEVDLVVERSDTDSVIGIEVKAASKVRADDWKGLRRLRDELGPRFRAGLVMYLGETPHRLDDRLYAMPIDKLWGGEPASPHRRRRVGVGRPASRPDRITGSPSGGLLTADGDPLRGPVRAATEAMIERMELGEGAYWEVAAVPSRTVHFGDFYSEAGVAGALHSLPIWAGGDTDPIDQCLAALHEPRRSILGYMIPFIGAVVHPLGPMVFVLTASGDMTQERDEIQLISGWTRTVSEFVHQVLAAHTDTWTLWSAGRRLRSGAPRFYGNTGVRQADAPLARLAVVDNPPHKGIPAGGGFEEEARQLRASFYEWFGVPASEIPSYL